jgi:hypothetical protein
VPTARRPRSASAPARRRAARGSLPAAPLPHLHVEAEVPTAAAAVAVPTRPAPAADGEPTGVPSLVGHAPTDVEGLLARE